MMRVAMSCWETLLELAREEVEATLGELPKPLREAARLLPVTYESRPSAELQADGVEPDTLGLFVGESLSQTGATSEPLPAQIILFLGNLWEFAEEDADAFQEEVHVTFLHELGHYLDLDEGDLYDRGLE